MGAKYRFRCSGCGYSADVCGGPSVGEAVRMETLSCATCAKLLDVVVSEEPWKEPPDPLPERLCCPRERRTSHRTSLWTAPGPCPRCGATITTDDAELILLWD